MDYDSYQLYDLLKDGAAATINHKDSAYTLHFEGRPAGSNNYLSVTDRRGQQKRFGYGWGSEQFYHALTHLEKGCDTPQVPRYKPYDEKAAGRAGTEWVEVNLDS
jgi:hypothetical protein